MSSLALPAAHRETVTLAPRVRAKWPKASPSALDREGRPAGNRLVPISATILTKDSSRLIAKVLAALDWCDEIVILDTGSTDDTLAIAASFAKVVIHRLAGPFPGFGIAHRHAVALARHDWILSVDSDEVVSPELAAEIRALPLDRECVYAISFRNYFDGRHITTCGWSPDCHERLFHRGVTNFCTSEVHERVQTAEVSVVMLKHPIDHYSYDSLSDFLRKMNAYATLFAEQNAGRRRAGPLKAVARSAWAFVKSYGIERGFCQGREGLVISAYKAQVVFWKYLMLHEANGRCGARA